MSTPGDRLNLRPFEKRLVAGVATLLFIVMNFWFVFPHFGDWTKLQDRYQMAQRKLGRYEAEVAQVAANKRLVAAMLIDEPDVPLEEQATHFSTAIASQAAQAGVSVPQTGRIVTRTNEFFIVQTQTISTLSGEPQLVDFLFKLGNGGSPIRVQGLTVRPDVPRQALSAGVTLVASYQKKSQAKTAAGAASRSATPGGEPSTTRTRKRS